MCCFRQFGFIHLVTCRGSRRIYRLLTITYCIQGNVRPLLFSPHSSSLSEGEFKVGQINSQKFFNYFVDLKEPPFLHVSGRIQTVQNHLQAKKGEKTLDEYNPVYITCSLF